MKLGFSERDQLRAPICPYCPGDVVATLESRGSFLRWECPTPGCDARVGIHRDSPKFTPLGTMARAARREARQRAHDAFDPLWRGPNPRFRCRSAAYAWLAAFLGIPDQRCHIGEFDEAQCERVLAAVHDLNEVPR